MGVEDQPKHWNFFSPHVMTPHCHAPSCIREELWNADTGQIICNVSAMYGKPAYGPSSAVFNEADYVAIPPCSTAGAVRSPAARARTFGWPVTVT